MGPRRRSTAPRFVLVVVLGMIASTLSLTFENPGTLAQTTSPDINLSQSSGLLGRTITVTGSDFGSNEVVDLRWRTTSASPTASARASSTGMFSTPFRLPDAPNGAQTIFATGRVSARQASAVYTVSRTAGQSSRISEGVYSVYATRIGLIGNITSSGHLVREHDYFVALPGCTPTNCPGGPYWGEMTNCGDKCYVKIINPQTNACRVDRILDVGPWFRVDDWWNPASQRYLNNLSSNPTTLAQGYTGSDAARNGYNVGYGIGASGFGNDDTGSQGTRPVRQVGNRAAIDLADGTWRSLNLVSDGTGARIRVEFLWQTGADPATQARGCGHSINQAASTGSPGASNPSFDGESLAPVSSTQSSNGSGASAVHDGSLSTAWQTTDSNPTTGSFTLDYGETRSLTGIRWRFSQFGHADRMWIETSTNGTSWTSVGVYGNAEPGQWRGQNVRRDARFVRFSFTNPNGDASLGHVAEVEAWSGSGAGQDEPPTPTPITGSNPQFTGESLPIVGSSATANTTSPTRAYDGNQGTSWTTTSSTTPGSASATLDLGQERQLSGIRWMYRVSGGADRMRLQISADGDAWTQLVTTSNRVPLTWEGWRTTMTARYVRFVFDNPNGASVLGYLAEVEVWGPATEPPQTPTPTPTPISLSTPSPTPTPSPSPTLTPTPSPTPTSAQFGSVVNTVGAGLRCRATASLSGAIITVLPEGSRVETRGAASGGWQPVRCQQRNGWVSTDYFRLESTSSAPTPTPTPTISAPVSGSGYVANTGGARLNCRSQPSLNGSIVTTLAAGAQVTLRGSPSNGWQGVRCANRDGFVSAQYISTQPPATTPTAPPAVTSTPTQPPAPVPTPPPATEPPLAMAGSNPQFAGSPLQVTDVWGDNSGSNPWRTIDGNEGTSWVSAPGSAQAILTLNLGSPQQLTGIRWMYLQSGGADRMRLQISTDRTNWTQLVTTSNRAPFTWEGWQTSATAQYVRLIFDNPNGVTTLGYVAEVQIWGFGNADRSNPETARMEADHRRLVVKTRSRVRRRSPRAARPDRTGGRSHLKRRTSTPGVNWSW